MEDMHGKAGGQIDSYSLFRVVYGAVVARKWSVLDVSPLGPFRE